MISWLYCAHWTGDDGVEDGRRLAFVISVICIILHNFAIFYDFDSFSISTLAVLRSLRFIHLPRRGDDGVEDGRRLCV